MGRIVKIPIVIALLAVVAFVAKATLLDSQEEQVEAARASNDVSAEASIDLSETQVNSIKIETVGTADFTPEVLAIGNIDFNQNLAVQVFTPYQGRIINAWPNIGDKVVKGQVLFTIDSPDLLSAEANLIQAAGVLKLQDATLKRAQQMKSFGGASQQAVDQSTSDQQTAEGALKSARDAVRIFGKTEGEIDDIVAARKADPTLVVRSPIDGFVTTRAAQPGLLVQPGAAPPVYTVADVSTMWMFANVVETDSPLLKVGQKLKARVAAFPDHDFDGTVEVIAPNVDPSSRRVFVRTAVKDPNRQLRAGMLGNFSITVGETRKATAAPEEAVVRESDGTLTAWVTTDKRHFIRRTLKIGATQNGFDEVLEGLQPGEQIVTLNAVYVSNQYALALKSERVAPPVRPNASRKSRQRLRPCSSRSYLLV